MAETRAAGEFELIERYFRPLAQGHAGALGLADDAALLEVPSGASLVVTTDTLVAGVHFHGADPSSLVGQKLLRVNLSDLAAMGARPLAYLLSVALSPDQGEEWLARFCSGLAADQDEFRLSLIGGDTLATPGPLTLTLTALGEVPEGVEIRRSGARPGDAVFVSGTVGDAALGLMVLGEGLGGLVGDLARHVIDRYYLPQPRVELGLRLRGLAHAAIDVSDGLVGDLAHVCEASGVGAVIDWPAVPLSAAARAALEADPSLVETVLGGGDDYELLFTAAAGLEDRVAEAAAAAGVAVTATGRITDGSGVTVVGADGAEIAVPRPGYRHF